MQDAKQTIINFFILKGVDIIGALIILAVGFLVARWIGNIVQRWLDKMDLEPPVRSLMVRFVRLMIIAFVLVIVLQQLGVPIAPMVAGIGVAGIGVGLAMQGLLGNIVAGLTIILTKPFRVGEYVELVGVHGLVTQIELLSTTLTHADRSRVVIPNRKIVGEILHNYGGIRQLDLSVGVAYSSNPSEVLATVNDILNGNPRVLKDPGPALGISTLSDSAILIAIKPWVKVDDYGPAAAEINKAIIETFRAKEIQIPFPQREVRLLNSADTAAA